MIGSDHSSTADLFEEERERNRRRGAIVEGDRVDGGRRRVARGVGDRRDRRESHRAHLGAVGGALEVEVSTNDADGADGGAADASDAARARWRCRRCTPPRCATRRERARGARADRLVEDRGEVVVGAGARSLENVPAAGDRRAAACASPRHAAAGVEDPSRDRAESVTSSAPSANADSAHEIGVEASA